MPINNPIQINWVDAENLSSQCNGSATEFSTLLKIDSVEWVSLNGGLLVEDLDFTTNEQSITLLRVVPETGEELYIKYIENTNG